MCIPLNIQRNLRAKVKMEEDLISKFQAKAVEKYESEHNGSFVFETVQIDNIEATIMSLLQDIGFVIAFAEPNETDNIHFQNASSRSDAAVQVSKLVREHKICCLLPTTISIKTLHNQCSTNNRIIKVKLEVSN